jgi:hypothetical protein
MLKTIADKNTNGRRQKFQSEFNARKTNKKRRKAAESGKGLQRREKSLR